MRGWEILSNKRLFSDDLKMISPNLCLSTLPSSVKTSGPNALLSADWYPESLSSYNNQSLEFAYISGDLISVDDVEAGLGK